MKLRLVLTMEYDADPSNYPGCDGDILAMCDIDRGELGDDPFLLAEMLEGRDYDLKIEPLPPARTSAASSPSDEHAKSVSPPSGAGGNP